MTVAGRGGGQHLHAMPTPETPLTSEPSRASPDVQWRRSARARKISLRIDPRAGGVIITLPLRAAQSAGLALLRDNAAWVADRLARLPAPVALSDGAMVPIGGVPHRLRHVPGARRGAWLDGMELHVSGAPEFLPRRALDFLQAEARRRLGALAAVKAGAAGLTVRRVVVKDTRSRWGSCTATGTLMFNWRLVTAPAHVSDYVVAHEVAHLRHMDHGRQFWALVAQLTPYHGAATHWLDANGAGLMRIG